MEKSGEKEPMRAGGANLDDNAAPARGAGLAEATARASAPPGQSRRLQERSNGSSLADAERQAPGNDMGCGSGHPGAAGAEAMHFESPQFIDATYRLFQAALAGSTEDVDLMEIEDFGAWLEAQWSRP